MDGKVPASTLGEYLLTHTGLAADVMVAAGAGLSAGPKPSMSTNVKDRTMVDMPLERLRKFMASCAHESKVFWV
jgi:hypothetical protein